MSQFGLCGTRRQFVQAACLAGPAILLPQGGRSQTEFAWKRRFYQREVSLPAAADETIEQVRKRAANVKPTAEKLAWMNLEFISFPHFGMSTFSGVQQGDGKQNPAIFNPEKFEAAQWVRVHKDAGIKMMVFVAKHHDGFSLWPTKANDYSVKSSPWRDGQGDMVKEMADACRKEGLKFGIYHSLWDQHDPRCNTRVPTFSAEAYNRFIVDQLTELFTNYGEITELWFDGAGTRGREDWDGIFDLINNLQPRALVSMCGYGIRWCGNEAATGDATEWNVQPIYPDQDAHRWTAWHRNVLIPKKADKTANDLEALRGKPLFWFPVECNTAYLRPWHFVAGQPPKTLPVMIEKYYSSIGAGGVLILGIAPDKTGLIPDDQAQGLHEFRQWIDAAFKTNLLENAAFTASTSARGTGPEYLRGKQPGRYWMAGSGATKAEITASLPREVEFNNIVLEEHIEIGQRVAAFTVDVWDGSSWNTAARGTTIGRRRVLPLVPVRGSKIRLTLSDCRDTPALRLFGLYMAQQLPPIKPLADGGPGHSLTGETNA
ncbi:MAG: alpha-L-fucosidase [Candidatus Solibacter sp.]